MRNIYALATALVASNQALGGTAPNDTRVFTQSDLVRLANSIPKEKDPVAEGVSQAILASKANLLTPLIKKLTDFYSYYSKSIMDHPAYRGYIQDELPLLTVQPGKDPAALDPSQSEKIKNSPQIALPVLRILDKEGRPINVDGRILLSSLQSRQELQKLMVNVLGFKPNEINNSAAMRRVVKTIIARINKIIEENKPIPKSIIPPLNKDQLNNNI